jgi:phosphoglycerol transferase MdoB-like AlkP superfamily enzyme
MKNISLFYVKYFLFWLVIQAFFRLLLLLFYPELSSQLTFTDKLLVFYHGLALDLSLVGYIMVVPTLALLVLSGIRTAILTRFMRIYTVIILILLVPLSVTNLVLYEYWHIPVDKSIFDYLNTPGEMVSSINTWYLVLLLLICAGLVYLFGVLIYKYLFRKHWSHYIPSWRYSFLFAILLPALIIPIRGGFGLPINTGTVYFHPVSFANHAAINPAWNLVYTFTETKNMDFEFQIMPEEEANEISGDLISNFSDYPVALIEPRANVIIIMLESFSQAMIRYEEGGQEVTPEFNMLIPKGIFFSNFYATGTMTDRGLGSVISGYPALSKTCIFRYERKLQDLPFLTRDLESNNYTSLFLYGGDIDFAHIRSYLLTSGFDRILANDDFPASIDRSKWGVPDEFVLDRLLEECNQAEQPFFYFCLTLSSHSPFDVPMEPVFEKTSKKMSFFNSAHYTDRCLGDFFRKAESCEWWQNSVVIMVADHGSRICSQVEYDRYRFHIPMLWIGGAVIEPGSVIEKYGSQADLPVTLLSQLGMDYSGYKFSKDLSNPSTRSYAMYTYHNGFGFLNDSTYAVYHYPTNRFLRLNEFRITGDTLAGLALNQSVVNDFTNR